MPQQLSPAAMKDSAIFYELFKRGNESFIKSDFKKAIELFENARKINPNFYPALENIGLSYFLMRDFGGAVKYLNMVLDTKASNDGKAEYYLGISLINIGKREEGCQSFLNSEAKKYYDARRLYDLNCVPQTAPPNQ
jgi:tetratricopeptide (TPR) repeat protein